jgi:pullulanase/glycogen debranching enzyme
LARGYRAFTPVHTYQVGNFPVDWSEWNGRFRDTVRRFEKGDAGQLSAHRLGVFERTDKADETIFEEGNPEQRSFLILQGKIAIESKQ